MNYRGCWEQGRDRLLAADPPDADAALDARLLLESVCGTSQETLLADGDRRVTKEEQRRYALLIARRVAHEPTAYILGEQYFMGLCFRVTPAVLIPEQDTETLVEEAMTALHDGMRILDLCTGSGCILLSLLHYSNGTYGVGTDLSGEALAVAEENARALGLSARCRFCAGDLYEALPEGTHKFQLVISNPPYIASGVIPGLMPEVSCFEPRMALDGGEDGLVFYRRILAGIRSWLEPGGLCLFETGSDEGEAVAALMRAEGFGQVRIARDLGGMDRVVRGMLPMRRNAARETNHAGINAGQAPGARAPE